MSESATRSCSACGAFNEAPRRFCGDCGMPLPVPCDACGFDNQGAARFCGGCGTSLLARDRGGASARVAADPQRRPVTVLFADLCGYTQLTQSVDAEEVHRLLQLFFARTDEVVERFGGTVDKHIGDAVMAVFGAPVAHGDEPLRAVGAAQAIIRALADCVGESGRLLSVHIGIASGEVIASGVGSQQHTAYTVIGQSVNLAARLVGIAGAGEVVIDGAVHDAVRRTVTSVALPGLTLKGLDRPVRAWKIESFDAPPDVAAIEPLVGRREEVARLATLLQRCEANGVGGVAILRGDPGIGKSRLAAELRSMATHRGFLCHTALVLDSGMAVGRDPIREIVGSLLACSPAADAAARGAALEAAVARGWCDGSHALFLGSLLNIGQSDEDRALLRAMDPVARQEGMTDTAIALLEGASATSPQLLLVEDVHWAPPALLKQLAAIGSAVARIPVALVLSTRLDGDPLGRSWQDALGSAQVLALDLGPLSDAEAGELAGDLVATSSGFARKCIARAAGNPLFLEQLLRAVQDSDDALPASLHSVVLARVDRLPERDRSALRAAAVIGQRFSLALVRELSGIADYECNALVAHHLVRRDGTEWLFSHALIRDGVYASMTRAPRNAMHLQAAGWYGRRDPVLRAEHLEHADSPLVAAAYYDAALSEVAQLRTERALALAERGASLTREQSELCLLHSLRSELLREIGDGRLAAEASRSALQAARSTQERSRALLGIASGLRLVGEVEDAIEALAQAERLARSEGLERELMQIHYLRGNLHFARTRIAECRAEHQVAFEAARALQDPEHEARALSGLGDADYAEGRIRTAFGRFAACLALCEAHDLTRIAIPNRVMLGHCRIYLAQFDAGLHDMQAAADMAARVGNRHAVMFALQSQGILLTACGRCAEAETSQQRARELAEALGARRYLAAILGHHAEVLLSRGEIAAARSELQQALPMARETGIGFAGPLVLGLLMRVSEDDASRVRYASEAEAVLASGSVSYNHFFFRRYAIEGALERGDAAEALRQAAALESYTAAEPLPYSDFVIRRARALAGLLHGVDARSRAAIEILKDESDRLGWSLAWPDS